MRIGKLTVGLSLIVVDSVCFHSVRNATCTDMTRIKRFASYGGQSDAKFIVCVCRWIRLKVDRERDRKVDGMPLVDSVRRLEMRVAFPLNVNSRHYTGWFKNS